MVVVVGGGPLCCLVPRIRVEGLVLTIRIGDHARKVDKPPVPGHKWLQDLSQRGNHAFQRIPDFFDQRQGELDAVPPGGIRKPDGSDRTAEKLCLTLRQPRKMQESKGDCKARETAAGLRK